MKHLLRFLSRLVLGALVAAAPMTVREAHADPTIPAPESRTVSANPTTGALGWPTASTFRSANGINDAANLTTGTLPDARFPATLPVASGINLTALNGTNIASGTVANARLTGNLSAIGALTSAADKLAYFTGSGTAGVTDFTAFGRSLVDDTNQAAARTTLGLVIGTDVQGYDPDLTALAGVTSAADKVPYFTGSGAASVATLTGFGRSLIDDAATNDAQSTLGLDGYVYVFCGMGKYRADQNLWVALSRDGLTWTVANNGASVYTAPSGGVRDVSPHYESSSGYFYIAYTAGSTGANGYFAIARSKTPWVSGSWSHVKNVSDPTGTPVDSVTSWGPSFFEDHVFVACADTGSTGDVTNLKLYETHPTTAGPPADYAGTWSDFALLTMPTGNTGYNEVKVFRSEWDPTLVYMIAWDFNHGNNVKIFTPTVAGVYTAWSTAATLTIPTSREGPFVIERPNGAGWWVYTEYSADNTVYKRYAYNASWVLQGSSLEPIQEVPAAAYPNGPGLANGEVIRVRHPIAASLGVVSPLGSVAKQDKDNVEFTGGTADALAITGSLGVSTAAGYAVKVPAHASFADGGLIMKNGAGSNDSIFGLGAGDNVLYLTMPTEATGFSIYNGAHNAPRMFLSDAGVLTVAAGEVLTAGNLAMTAGQLRVGSDSGWGTGGVRFYVGGSTASAFIGCFDSGQFAMRLGTDGGGLVIYASDGSTLVSKITNAGYIAGPRIYPSSTAATTGPFLSSGSGSPESAVTAPVGSIYMRTDGGAATSMYVKESGAGNTGWVGK